MHWLWLKNAGSVHSALARWIGHQDEGSALKPHPTAPVDEIVRFFTPLSIVNPPPRNKEHAGEKSMTVSNCITRRRLRDKVGQFREGRVGPST